MLRPALIALAALWASPAPAQRCADPPGASADLLAPPAVIRIAQRTNGGGQLLSLDYDACEKVYQVKLIREGVVTLIYVDAREGRVVGIVGG